MSNAVIFKREYLQQCLYAYYLTKIRVELFIRNFQKLQISTVMHQQITWLFANEAESIFRQKDDTNKNLYSIAATVGTV